MDVDDPHAPLDPTASGSGHAPPPAAEATGQASRRHVFSNADFYTSHFEAHVASVAAHFRGETTEEPIASNMHLFSGTSTFPSAHFAWSEADKNLFYASLRRRGKSWPELIAADMAGRKSLVEVTAYLARLDEALDALPAERRKQLRVPPLPAREVSDRWIKFEEDMASDYLDRSRKRERADEVGARQAERDRALKQVKRTIPPPPWRAPGAGPRTPKQKRRREAQLKAARQELEKDFAREDWLRLLDKDKAVALSREIKQPSRLGAVQPGASDDDSDDKQGQSAATDLIQPAESSSRGTPATVVTFEGNPAGDRATSTCAKEKPARIPFRGGQMRREIVVMRLGDILRDKGLDVLSFKVAHQALSQNLLPGSDPLEVPLTVLEEAVALLRAHVKRVLQRALALRPPDQDSELERSSASDSKASFGFRLFSGKLVQQALESLQGAEADHWVDEASSTLAPSTQASPEPPTSSMRATSEANEAASAAGDDGDDEDPVPIVSIVSLPVRIRLEPRTATLGDTIRPVGEPALYRPHARLAKDQPPPAGVALVPFDPEPLKPATFFTDGGPSDALVDVSDDEIEADRVKAEDDEADALQNQADLAADHAWEDGLWATISAMDPDGLAWLTLGNLIDTENADLAAVHILSDDDDDDDDNDEQRSEVGMSEDGMGAGAVPSSRYSISASPPPRAKAERASQL